MNVRDGYEAVCEAIAKAWRIPPVVTVDQWADQHRMLSSKAAAEPGPWRTDRVPYSREIMQVLSANHPAERIVFMKSSQVAGTEIGNNWIGSVIATQPAPMLCVAATVEMAELWSKQRLAPMIQDAKVLREKISPARSRDSGNTTLLKDYPGGTLRLTGANSPASLASMPAKYLFLDETDRFEQEVGDEGDPITLAERRTTTFTRRKIFLVSTPTVLGISRITKEYEASDQRRYYVHCPDCGGAQYLKWANIKFDKTARPIKEAHYVCEHCGVLIAEHHKTTMLQGGKWIATYPEREIVGFHINALYCPVGLGKSWAEMAEWFLTVKDDPTKLKGFINTGLGEAWDNTADRLKASQVQSLAEDYELRTIPKGCLILTAGVDVQGNRVEVQVVGWGRRETAWAIDYLAIDGDPSQPEIWQQLADYIAKPFVNQYGVPMRILMHAVDSGFATHEVYNYCRHNRHRGAFPTKGWSTPHKPIIGRPSPMDVNWRGKTIKHGVDLYNIGADTAKSALYARFLAAESLPPEARQVHFSKQLSEEYFKGLTCEVYDIEKGKWYNPPGARNEPLDTFVGAYAAALHPRIRLHVMKDHEWQAIEEKIQPAMGDLFTQAPVANDNQPIVEPAVVSIRSVTTKSTSRVINYGDAL